MPPTKLLPKRVGLIAPPPCAILRPRRSSNSSSNSRTRPSTRAAAQPNSQGAPSGPWLPKPVHHLGFNPMLHPHARMAGGGAALEATGGAVAMNGVPAPSPTWLPISGSGGGSDDVDSIVLPRNSILHLPTAQQQQQSPPPASVLQPPSPQAMQAQIDELGKLLKAQQALMAQQQATMDELRLDLSKHALQQPPAAASGTGAAAAAPQPTYSPMPLPVAGPIPGLWEVPKMPTPARWDSAVRPFEAQRKALADRRPTGFDARFHSTSAGATPQDYRILPANIILIRHAESEGNQDEKQYVKTPDNQIELTALGHQQSRAAGQQIREILTTEGNNYGLFFYTSPYRRSLQTYQGISTAFAPHQVRGVQQEVQLREQDFGNFQNTEGKKHEKAERLRFGRFFYRFPNGESGADVYDRLTLFEDHLIRDINAGRFGTNSTLVVCTHGLALRVFLMRWFHWTVDQFMDVYNPPNAVPIVLQRVAGKEEALANGPFSWVHTKALYRLSNESQDLLRGCSTEMCSSSFCDSG